MTATGCALLTVCRRLPRLLASIALSLPYRRRVRSRVWVAAVLALLAAVCGGCRGRERVAPGPPPEPEVGTVELGGRRFTVCRVDLASQQLELFWRDDKGEAFRSFAALDEWLRARGRRLIFAMNAGMYREDSSPVGLYVEHQKELRPLNRARGDGSNFCLLPNGVFALTDSGAVVVETSHYPAIAASASLATQSGPMLVIDGKLHPRFGRNSTSRLIRNGVGVVSPTQVVFAISEDPVNFYEFATFFRDKLRCDSALYLDGTVSSLFSTALNRNDHRADLGPILAVVGDVTRAP
jgi:uncharacterized protein YigE (DUF2233 family)